MFNGIPITSDLFERPVIDEINNGFQSIYDSIQELEVPHLKYHYPVKDFLVTAANSDVNITNRSFMVGRELILDFTFSFKRDFPVSTYTKALIARVNVNNPYNYFGRVIEENGLNNYRFYFNNFEIFISGNGDNETETIFKKDVPYIIQARIIL